MSAKKDKRASLSPLTSPSAASKDSQLYNAIYTTITNSKHKLPSSAVCNMNSKDMKLRNIKIGDYISVKSASLATNNRIVVRVWPSKTLLSGLILLHSIWKGSFPSGSKDLTDGQREVTVDTSPKIIVSPCKKVVFMITNDDLDINRPSELYQDIKGNIFKSYLLDLLSTSCVDANTCFTLIWKGRKVTLTIGALITSTPTDSNDGLVYVLDNRTEIQFQFSETQLNGSIEDRSSINTTITQCHNYFNDNLNLFPGYTDEIQEVWNALNKCFHYTIPHLQLPAAGMKIYSILSKPPKGVLLYGPRGIGKSKLLSNFTQLLSKSQRKICNIMELNHSILLKRQVGEVERELHGIFQGAANLAPCVIIIDDIDLLFKNRNGPNVSELDKRLVSCFLSLLDGVNEHKGVFIIATSSNTSAIDPALRRPGRIDKEIELSIPNTVVRKEILKSLLAEYNIADENFVQELVLKSDGMVYSDLVLVMKEAYYNAVLDTSPLSSDDVDNLAEAIGNLDLQSTHNKSGSSSITPELQLIISNTLHNSRSIHIQPKHVISAVQRVTPSAIKDITIEVPTVRWDHIGGYEATKESLKEVITWPVLYADLFEKLQLSPPRGILLYGPPGCSKTLMAKAIASESGMNFIPIKGPELLSKWLGESEKAIQKLFNKARAASPCIIFFDEIDAMASKRDDSSTSVNTRVLSQLLTEMDGVQDASRVIVIGATNRPDAIDKALLRPGRIDRKIYIPPPDDDSRKQIFLLELKNKYDESNTDIHIDELVQLTNGYSGAEIVATCSEAVMIAIDNNCNTLQRSYLLKAISDIKPMIDQEMLEYYHNIVF